MRIEIYSGSRITGISTDLNRLQDSISETISSLQKVDRRINELSGGPQRLATASSEIQERIRIERVREQSVTTVKLSIGHFLESVRDTDNKVSQQVSGSTDKFFDQYSWLRPVVPEEKSWWDRRVEDWNNFWGAVGEGLANAWEAIKSFYVEHKKIIDTVVIVVGAVVAVAAVVLSGGTALVPLLGYIGFSAGTAAAISATVATVAVVSTIGAATLNLVDTWAEIDNPVFNTFQNVLNITSTVTNLAYSIGTLFNSWNGVSAKEIATFKNEGYTSQQIRDAVRQDRILKVNFKKISLMSDREKGNYGEMLADKMMREQGYKRVSGETITSLQDSIHQGIDGTYQRGSSYSIGDAKYDTAQLKTLTDGTKQMSKKWIIERLPNDVGPDLAKDLKSLTNVDRLLINVNPGGSNPTAIKISYLDDFAKVIRGRTFYVTLDIPNISFGDFSANFSTLSNLFAQQVGSEAK